MCALRQTWDYTWTKTASYTNCEGSTPQRLWACIPAMELGCCGHSSVLLLNISRTFLMNLCWCRFCVFVFMHKPSHCKQDGHRVISALPFPPLPFSPRFPPPLFLPPVSPPPFLPSSLSPFHREALLTPRAERFCVCSFRTTM